MLEYLTLIVFFVNVKTILSAKVDNIALNKTADQAYPYTDGNGVEWSAGKAVEGCILSDLPESQLCCSATLPTSGQTDNYWQVNLGGVRAIGAIIVYGRSDGKQVQLAGFQVYGLLTSGGAKEHLYNSTGVEYPVDGIFNITVKPEKNASIIRVEKPPGDSIITLCEVEVFEASKSKYPTRNEIGNMILLCLNYNIYQYKVLQLTCPEVLTEADLMNAFEYYTSNLNTHLPCTACDDGTYGSGCEERCGKCADGGACDKVTGTCPPGGCEAGWTGDMCWARANILLLKPATQTSTMNGRNASLAVDGCADQGTPSCCSSTGAEGNASLILNPGGVYEIGRIVVYGETGGADKLAGFMLYDSPSMQPRMLLYDSSPQPYGTGIYDFPVDPPVASQSLILERISDSPAALVVCEVQAYIVCPAGFYGDRCEDTCGNCVQNDTCHGIIGRCSNGCAAGWREDLCKTDENGSRSEFAISIFHTMLGCQNGTFGENCNMTCGACKDNVPCNIATGACPDGCESGYQGDTCLNECSNGTWGWNCNETCGYCADGASCNASTGTCMDGCASGYSGDMCMEGNNWSNTPCMLCLKLVSLVFIYFINGPLSFHQYHKCVSPQFGPDCLSMCYCTDNATCNHVTGECPSFCQPGWQGDSCSNACDNSTFGQNCSGQCGQCMDNVTCDVIDGTCEDGCAPGWLLDTCAQKCEEGYFGANCSETCGQCADGASCDHETGACAAGCASGWKGSETSCKTECSSGEFGADCAGRCFCADGVPCNATSGLCPSECDAGIVGEFCEIDLNRAKNKPAAQSSTEFAYGFNFSASLAVDGNWEQAEPNKSRTCSLTKTFPPDVNPWWYVDMQGVSRIESVLVYGRNDTEGPQYLSGFLLYAVNNTDVGSAMPDYTNTGDYGDGVFNVTFDDVIFARYVYITLNKTESLSLCEVRVLGECADGTFGLSCEGRCYCAEGAACDKETGVCPPGGCEPGYTGDMCDTQCANDTYGTGCLETCGACADDGTCDFVTGVCPNSCSAGWLGEMCDTVCSFGAYGDECNGTCGWCKDNVTCNHVTGMCMDGCAAGYNGTMCTEGLCPPVQHGCTGTAGDYVRQRNMGTAGRLWIISTRVTREHGDGGDYFRQSNMGTPGRLWIISTRVTWEHGYGVSWRYGDGGDYSRQSNMWTRGLQGNISARVIIMRTRGRQGIVSAIVSWGHGDGGDYSCQRNIRTQCVNGTYGENCAQICGRCVNDTVCDLYNGSCEFGCAEGFTGLQCSP
ncbi:MEGF6-like protein, partial [Mya arenaria]